MVSELMVTPPYLWGWISKFVVTFSHEVTILGTTSIGKLNELSVSAEVFPIWLDVVSRVTFVLEAFVWVTFVEVTFGWVISYTFRGGTAWASTGSEA